MVSHKEEEREKHLWLVLQILKGHKFYAQFNKYEFWLNKVGFSRHIILEKGTYMDPQKVESMINLEQPTNVTEVLSFLKLVGYCCHFVKGFSKIAVLFII